MGVSYLIDTHILLWWLFNDSKLSAECQNIIRNPDNRIIVSSVSAWEIATKYRIGKLPDDPEQAAAATETIDNLKLNIPKLQATRSGAIDSIYNDPDLQLPLSDDEIDKLIHYYSRTDEDGKYQPYCQSIEYVLKQEKMDRRS